MEIWRDAPGFEGYQVSNEGRVKSLNYNHTGREKLLIPAVDGGGYLFVKLYKDGKRKTKYIHKLAAEAFMPNPLNLPQVNHKDENKLNNTVWLNEDGSVDLEKSNLEWCTATYNCNYGTRNQRMAESLKNSQKAKEQRNKLHEKLSKPVYQRTLDEILVKIWSSVNECGRNGFNSGAVSECCNNKYKREGNNRYKNYIWEYGD